VSLFPRFRRRRNNVFRKCHYISDVHIRILQHLCNIQTTCSVNTKTFAELCDASDNRLFYSRPIISHPHHILNHLLPSVLAAAENYNLRPRKHNRLLPERITRLFNANFIYRTLFFLTFINVLKTTITLLCCGLSTLLLINEYMLLFRASLAAREKTCQGISLSVDQRVRVTTWQAVDEWRVTRTVGRRVFPRHVRRSAMRMRSLDRKMSTADTDPDHINIAPSVPSTSWAHHAWHLTTGPSSSPLQEGPATSEIPRPFYILTYVIYRPRVL